jgi:HK97 family phage major capsid protein
MPTQQLTDQELFDQFTATMEQTRSATSEELSALKRDIVLLKQKSSRPPGSMPAAAFPGADPEIFRRRPSSGLAANSDFAAWISSSKQPLDKFSAQLPFELKAATPTTNVGLPSIVPGIVGAPQFPLRVQNLLFHVPISSGSAVFVKEASYSPLADIQATEGARKSQSSMTFTNQTATVITLATFAKCSTQALSDTPGLQNWFDSRLSYAVFLRQEQYLLLDPVNGLLTLAPAQGTITGTPTGLDMVAAAIGSLTALGFTPSGIILSPTDVTALRLLKNSLGDYLWSSPSGAVGTGSMWGLPVVESPVMPQGQFLVGDFSSAAVLFEREVLGIQISFENEDDFVNNLATTRGELRCVLAVPLPSGLLQGTLPAGSLAQAQHAQHAPVKR